jgi:protein TonB
MTIPLRLDSHAMSRAWNAGVAPARARPVFSRPRRWIGWAAAVSALLHAALLLLALLWLHRPLALLEAAVEPATVQLVMSPPGSDKPRPSTSPQPAVKAAPESVEAAAPPAPKPAPAQPMPAPAPPAPAAEAEALPPPAPATPKPEIEAKPIPPTETPPAGSDKRAQAPAAAASATTAAPPASQTGLVFDFGAVESDTNALVTGDIVVPASVDTRFHNRKPSYPVEAAEHGAQGTVFLMIHVGTDGLVTGVDVIRSSGHASLDAAARDAVVTWHFLPSVKDGQPITADFPMRIKFDLW